MLMHLQLHDMASHDMTLHDLAWQDTTAHDMTLRFLWFQSMTRHDSTGPHILTYGSCAHGKGKGAKGAKKAELCTFMLPEVTDTYSS